MAWYKLNEDWSRPQFEKENPQKNRLNKNISLWKLYAERNNPWSAMPFPLSYSQQLKDMYLLILLFTNDFLYTLTIRHNLCVPVCLSLLLYFILPLCLKWNNIHWQRLCFLLLVITHRIILECSLFFSVCFFFFSFFSLIIGFDLCLGNTAFFPVLSWK